MNLIQPKVMSAGILFLTIFLSGYWLGFSGKPYNTILFTVHKLLALGTGIFLILSVIRAHPSTSLLPVEITFMVLSGVFFFGTMAAGGLVSIYAEGGLGNSSHTVRATFSMAHQLLPYFTVLATAVTLYLMFLRK